MITLPDSETWSISFGIVDEKIIKVNNIDFSNPYYQFSSVNIIKAIPTGMEFVIN